MAIRTNKVEGGIGKIVAFDDHARAVRIKLVDWLLVGHRLSVREAQKDYKGRWIENPHKLRLKFKMAVKSIRVDRKSLEKVFPGQIVWVREVPLLQRKKDEPKEGDLVFRVWDQHVGGNGPIAPDGPRDGPKPPHPEPPPKPPEPEPPPKPPGPKPPEPKRPEDDEEEPDLPEPDDSHEEDNGKHRGKHRKGRGIGG